MLRVPGGDGRTPCLSDAGDEGVAQVHRTTSSLSVRGDLSGGNGGGSDPFTLYRCAGGVMTVETAIARATMDRVAFRDSFDPQDAYMFLATSEDIPTRYLWMSDKDIQSEVEAAKTAKAKAEAEAKAKKEREEELQQAKDADRKSTRLNSSHRT